MPQTFDVSKLLDDGKVNKFILQVLIVSVLIIFIDGFDINNIAFAAPALIKAWSISNRSALGPVFSAAPFGLLFGAPLLGYVGDRYGRKAGIISSGLIFSIFTWAAVLTTSLNQLFWIRLLCGVGVGGLLPNVVALNVEYAPKRLRATLVIVMFSGIGLGSAVPGPVAAWLVPRFGWQIMFILGGVAGIIASLVCAFGLPESIKYLSFKKERRPQIAKLLSRVRPDVSFGPDAVFSVRDEKEYTGFSPKYLFEDGLARLTVLLWVIFVAGLMGYFFLISWTPTLLAGAKIPVAKAALFTSIFQMGGLIGGWSISRPIDRRGMMPVALLYLLAIPIVACIGYVATFSEPLLMICLFAAGFCVLGTNYAANAVAGIIYPTAFRASGAGWACMVGRLGGVGGPLIGGVLIGMHLSIQRLYLLATIPFIIAAPATYMFARLYNPRFHTKREEDGKVLTAAKSAAVD